jgi:hypothetical protein
MSSDSPQDASDRPARRPKRLRAVLYAALVSAGVLAAWQAHEHYFAAGDGRAPRPQRHPAGAASGEAETWPASNPFELLIDPSAAAGIPALEGDPGGIASPAGARRLWAGRRRWSGGVQETAMYRLAPSAADAAVAHYRDAMAARGFALREDFAASENVRVLAFARGRTRVTLSLRTVGKEAKMVRLVLSVTRFDDDGAAG